MRITWPWTAAAAGCARDVVLRPLGVSLAGTPRFTVNVLIATEPAKSSCCCCCCTLEISHVHMKSQKSHKEKKGRVLLIRSSAQNSLAFYFCMCGRRSNWKVLVVIIPVIIIMFHHRQLFSFFPFCFQHFWPWDAAVSWKNSLKTSGWVGLRSRPLRPQFPFSFVLRRAKIFWFKF